MHISRSPPYTPSPVLSLSPCPQHPTRLAVSCPRHLSNHSQTGQRTPSSQANTAAQQREKRRASQCTSTRLMSASLPLTCAPYLVCPPLNVRPSAGPCLHKPQDAAQSQPSTVAPCEGGTSSGGTTTSSEDRSTDLWRPHRSNVDQRGAQASPCPSRRPPSLEVLGLCPPGLARLLVLRLRSEDGRTNGFVSNA
jgi:hypothetical protein